MTDRHNSFCKLFEFSLLPLHICNQINNQGQENKVQKHREWAQQQSLNVFILVFFNLFPPKDWYHLYTNPQTSDYNHYGKQLVSNISTFVNFPSPQTDFYQQLYHHYYQYTEILINKKVQLFNVYVAGSMLKTFDMSTESNLMDYHIIGGRNGALKVKGIVSVC